MVTSSASLVWPSSTRSFALTTPKSALLKVAQQGEVLRMWLEESATKRQFYAAMPKEECAAIVGNFLEPHVLQEMICEAAEGKEASEVSLDLEWQEAAVVVQLHFRPKWQTCKTFRFQLPERSVSPLDKLERRFQERLQASEAKADSGLQELQREVKALRQEVQELKDSRATQQDVQKIRSEMQAELKDATNQALQRAVKETQASEKKLQEALRLQEAELTSRIMAMGEDLQRALAESQALRQDLQAAVKDSEAMKKDVQQLKGSQAAQEAAMQGMMQAVQDRATQKELQKAVTEAEATKKDLHELKEASKKDFQSLQQLKDSHATKQELQKIHAESQAMKQSLQDRATKQDLQKVITETHAMEQDLLKESQAAKEALQKALTELWDKIALLPEEERKRRNWKLFVQNPYCGEGFRSSGHHFLMEDSDYSQKATGAASNSHKGVIEATLEEPVHVNAVTIAPLKKFNNGRVAFQDTLSIEVKSPETGLFETLRAKIPEVRKEETFQVGRVISALRLNGCNVGISKLIFS